MWLIGTCKSVVNAGILGIPPGNAPHCQCYENYLVCGRLSSFDDLMEREENLRSYFPRCGVRKSEQGV